MQVARALNFLHSSSLATYHRDIKAENILIANIQQRFNRSLRRMERSFQIKLSDFGQVVDPFSFHLTQQTTVAARREFLHPAPVTVALKSPGNDGKLTYCCYSNCLKDTTPKNEASEQPKPTNKTRIRFDESSLP